jgi:hypothetical protein
MHAAEQVEASKAQGKAEPVVNAASEEPRNFSLFPKLPIEVRLKIWGHASSVTRNVDVWAASLGIELKRSLKHKQPIYFYSSLPPPAVLHVNSESRSEGLKHYALDFDTALMTTAYAADFTISIPGMIYFNWNHDRLCLLHPFGVEGKPWPLPRQWADLHTKCLEKGLRYLAINIAHDCRSHSAASCTNRNRFLKHFPRKSNLEEVVLFICRQLADRDSLKVKRLKVKRLKVKRLEFEDLDSKEQSEWMKYAKIVLAEKLLKGHIEKNGEISGGGTPLIRTCKIILEPDMME